MWQSATPLNGIASVQIDKAMYTVFLSALVAPLATLLWYLYQKCSVYPTERSARLQFGCQKPPRYPHRDLWGYDLVRDRINSLARGEGWKIYEKHFEQYGNTFEEHFFFQKTITTMEPANIKHVFAVAPKDFSKHESKTRKATVRKLLGTGIVTVDDGPEWKQSRDLIRPIFSRGELADVNIIGKHVDHLIEVIPRDGSTFDVQLLLKKMFLEAASEFLLGEPLNAFSDDPPAETVSFIQNFDRAVCGFIRWRHAPRLSYLRNMFPNDYDKACKHVHSFIDRHVHRALQETAPNTHPSTPTPSSNPHRYIFLHELALRIRTPLKIRSEVTNLFLVARENVASLTAAALFHLARHPSEWAHLRTSILSRGISHPLTFDFLKSLTQVRNIYNETLRLQGPAIPLTRHAIKNTILPTGGSPDGTAPIFVAKGTQIVVHNWSLHHSPALFGPDPHAFRPSRWESSTSSKWSFVPFGAGARICPAQNQVYTHFAYVLVRMCREFEGLENRDAGWEYRIAFRLTAEAEGGVKVGVRV
ncbi:MAG: hypothetical protein Q9160_008476 [Pyrenula sp. 1 TL-2023]